MKNIHKIGEKIYITSDEEIKHGDWCYDKVLNIVFQTDKHTNFAYINLITNNVLKIILTTDQDLERVQSIDDEFLEWFVKNPSCEWVEIEEESNTVEVSNMFYTEYNYKTIIPKEETKQDCNHDMVIKYGVAECQNCGMEEMKL